MQADLKLMTILLPQLPECWGYRHTCTTTLGINSVFEKKKMVASTKIIGDNWSNENVGFVGAVFLFVLVSGTLES